MKQQRHVSYNKGKTARVKGEGNIRNSTWIYSCLKDVKT